MPSRIAALFILLTVFPRRAVGAAIEAATNGSKAGLAWPNANNDDINQYLTTGKVQWYYNWSPDPISANIEFVPMLWGTRQTSDWDNNINNTIKQYQVTHLLGFNEPEIAGQSNISPTDGATEWKAHIEPLKGLGVKLGAPAPSGAPEGKQWLVDWMTACQGGCTVDFMPLHWYDINSTAFMEYLEDYHNTFQKPLWVTEWACQNFNQPNQQCSSQDIIDFMNATQTFMEETEWIERYAWFGAMEYLQGVNQENALMSSDGKINTLGQQYIGAITPNVSSDYQPGVVHGGAGVSAPSQSPSSSDILRARLPQSIAPMAVLSIALSHLW
ncbi:glycosyl hydrolase catalytic core-domain-containing protein [Lenzites betulinus]|nr:glycosyl hydrolase catalytic core-domain-containing protein [Lenzites betulinus]